MNTIRRNQSIIHYVKILSIGVFSFCAKAVREYLIAKIDQSIIQYKPFQWIFFLCDEAVMSTDIFAKINQSVSQSKPCQYI